MKKDFNIINVSNHSPKCDGSWETIKEQKIIKEQYSIGSTIPIDIIVGWIYIQKCKKCNFIRSEKIDI